MTSNNNSIIGMMLSIDNLVTSNQEGLENVSFGMAPKDKEDYEVSLHLSEGLLFNTNLAKVREERATEPITINIEDLYPVPTMVVMVSSADVSDD
ncbi:hypothetical protein PG985_009742 [Apiospora marii]|uniref:uncharacterized protein n=1 Tax=Apiospora marii TaxID=335849 RepID=UPI00312E6A67